MSRRGRIRTQHDVSENLVVVHLDVADGDTEAQDLLKLEFNGGANFGELIREVLSV